MGRPKGSKNKKKEIVNSNTGISILEETERVEERIIPVLIYDVNSNRTKGIEKRLVSLINRHKSFYIQTNILPDTNQYFIDSGGWVFSKSDVEFYDTLVCHVKNLLPFLGGNNPVWIAKRTYVRHNVNRGQRLG
tara:strand:- start:485 stop:886 length:402 start_codon:yes stop_codon:yes gene_type:complete